MSYYRIVDGNIELTDCGISVLDYLGLSLDELKNISRKHLIEHCNRFSDVLNNGIISKGQNGATTGNEPSTLKEQNTYGDYRGYAKPSEPRGDEGSFSRYFDLDAWFKERIKKLPKEAQKTYPFLIVPKASTSEKDKGLESARAKQWRGTYKDSNKLGILDKASNSPKTHAKNFHPTCKPIQLMSYLVTLGSRKGDIILDPFMGSGTTAIACKHEARQFIGFEKDKTYYEEICMPRVKAVQGMDEGLTKWVKK